MKIKPRIRVYSIIVPDRYYDPESKTGKFTPYFGFELLSRNFGPYNKTLEQTF